MTVPRGVVVLGSTGSIGTQTLDVIRSFPNRFRVLGLAAGASTALLERQLAEFDVPWYSAAANIAIPGRCRTTMVDLARLDGVDLVVVATTSTSALSATLAALDRGRDVATANKEVLVAAGELITRRAAAASARILPIDSEHSAIWQCLRGEGSDGLRVPDSVSRILLTASGGAFRDTPLDDLPMVGPDAALKHPVWRMGAKITIDTATLVNKAFEVIESRWLFDVWFDKIRVLIHRESIIHSIVQFVDGSSKAQLGLPDMRVPIQYALTFPDRLSGPVEAPDYAALGALTFSSVDARRYPAFDVVIEAGRRGLTYPAAISATNDVAVEWFASGRCAFPAIADTLARCLDAHDGVPIESEADVIEAEDWARQFARHALA